MSTCFDERGQTITFVDVASNDKVCLTPLTLVAWISTLLAWSNLQLRFRTVLAHVCVLRASLSCRRQQCMHQCVLSRGHAKVEYHTRTSACCVNRCCLFCATAVGHHGTKASCCCRQQIWVAQICTEQSSQSCFWAGQQTAACAASWACSQEDVVTLAIQGILFSYIIPTLFVDVVSFASSAVTVVQIVAQHLSVCLWHHTLYSF